MMHHQMGWGGWAIGCLMMLAFWAAIFWVVVQRTRTTTHASNESTAEAILAERFARGELTMAEFEAAREAIRR
jgi:uncharacterized membrane protein